MHCHDTKRNIKIRTINTDAKQTVINILSSLLFLPIVFIGGPQFELQFSYHLLSARHQLLWRHRWLLLVWLSSGCSVPAALSSKTTSTASQRKETRRRKKRHSCRVRPSWKFIMQVWCFFFLFVCFSSAVLWLAFASLQPWKTNKQKGVWVFLFVFSLRHRLFTSWWPASRSGCHGNDKKWPPPTPTDKPVGRLAEVILPVWVTGTSSFIAVTHFQRSLGSGWQREKKTCFKAATFFVSVTPWGGRRWGFNPSAPFCMCWYACVCVWFICCDTPLSLSATCSDRLTDPFDTSCGEEASLPSKHLHTGSQAVVGPLGSLSVPFSAGVELQECGTVTFTLCSNVRGGCVYVRVYFQGGRHGG